MTITGTDKSASSAMEKVSSNAQSMGKKVGSAGHSIGSVFAGIQLSQLADRVASFAKNAAESLGQLAENTTKAQASMGGTAEQVSELTATADRYNISQNTLVTAAGQVSKAIVAGNSPLQSMGISIKNADGSYRSFTDLLPDIATKIAGMSSSTQKAAAAQDIFGKSGKTLLPLLNQGGDGIAAMNQKAKQLGDTIGGDSVENAGKYVEAQKDLKEAQQGVQLQISQLLLPVMTKLTSFLSGTAVPALTTMFQWMDKHRTLVGVIATVLGSLAAVILVVVAAQKAWTIIQGILNAVMDANPLMLIVLAIGLLVAAIVLLVTHWQQVVDFLKSVWGAAVSWLQGTLKNIGSWWNTTWTNIKNFFKDAFQDMLNFLLKWTPEGIVITHWQKIKDTVKGAGTWLLQGGKDLVSGLINGVESKIGDVETKVKSLGGKAKSAVSDAKTWLVQVGRDAITGFITGVEGKIGDAVAKVESLGKKVTSGIQNILKSHSDSVVFHDIGADVGNGFTNGILSKQRHAVAAAQKLVSTPAGAALAGAGSSGGAGGVTVHITNKTGVALSDLIDMRIEQNGVTQSLNFAAGLGR